MSMLGIQRFLARHGEKKVHTGNETQAGQENVDDEVATASSL